MFTDERSCHRRSEWLRLATVWCLAMMVWPPSLAAQETAPQPNDPLRMAYEHSTRAQTEGQLSTVLHLCSQALAGDLSETNRRYAAQLMSWTFKKRGLVRTDAGQPLAAIADFTKVIELAEFELSENPSSTNAAAARTLLAWSHNKRGELQAGQKHEREALTDFERSIEYDANGWQALHNRGVSYAMLGRIEEAGADFDRVIAMKSDFAPVWFNRGELRQQQGELREALEDYDRALELKPKDRATYVSRGQAQHGLSNYEAALEDYGQAVRIGPKHSAAYIHRGTTLVEIGRYADAAKDYKTAIRLDVQNPTAYQAAAWMMATCPDERFRDARLAVQTAQRAIELCDAKDVRCLETLAAAYASAGQFGQAASTQRKAVALLDSESLAPADVMKKRLALYERSQPYRQSLPVATAARAEQSLK